MIVTFAIGNSDDKLPQAAWSAFVGDVIELVDQAVADGARIQFMGCSGSAAPWQNALWALELGPYPEVVRGALRAQLADLCGKYGQDAIAWWETPRAEMIPPAQVPG